MMEFTLLNELQLPEQIFDVSYHPTSDTDLVAAVTVAGHVYIIEDGKVTSILKRHHKGSPIRKIVFRRDNELVTIAKTVKLYDLFNEETHLTLRRDDDRSTPFYSVKTFGLHIICAGDDDGELFVWDTRTPMKTVFKSHDCQQYISDIDGRSISDAERIVCTSGEGTLTAYDLRVMKMIEPQSELFEAGFQCVKWVETNKKVVIGGEDGAVYIFNRNEWAHTSGKFALTSDAQNRGKCSVDCINIVPETYSESKFIAGCSDGRLRSFSLWPHQLLGDKLLVKKSPIESIDINPREGVSQVVVCGGDYLNFVSYEEKSDDETNADTDTDDGETPSPSADSAKDRDSDDPSEDTRQKKLKVDTDDYLNVFK